jgi:hypothetical protein
MVRRKRYTLFLQSRCDYACRDHETSAFGPGADVQFTLSRPPNLRRIRRPRVNTYPRNHGLVEY